MKKIQDVGREVLQLRPETGCIILDVLSQYPDRVARTVAVEDR